MKSAVALVFAFLIGVCAAAQAADEIVVGAVVPLTGPFAFAGPDLDKGLRDSLQIANDEGGIHGKPLKYVSEDGKYDLETAKRAFNNISSAFAPMVMYGESTALGKAVAGDIKTKLKLLYSSTSFSSELADAGANPYVFVPGPTYGDMFGILLKFIAHEQPKARVAFFYSDTEFGKDPIPFGRLMCKRLRLELVAEEIVKFGAKDITPQIESLKAANPDFVIFQGFLIDPMPEVIKRLTEAGLRTKFMGTFWSASKAVIDKLGPLAENYMPVNPYMYWWNEDVPMIKKIRTFTEKRYSPGESRDNYYMQGFMTGLIFTECMRRADRAAGGLTRETVVQALSGLRDFDSGGLAAPFTNKNNRFPVARVWKVNTLKGIYEPASEWLRLEYD